MKHLITNIYIHIYIYIYIYTHTADQKFGISTIFYVFKEVSSAHPGCIYLIKNTEKKYCNLK